MFRDIRLHRELVEKFFEHCDHEYALSILNGHDEMKLIMSLPYSDKGKNALISILEMDGGYVYRTWLDIEKYKILEFLEEYEPAKYRDYIGRRR